MEIDKDLLDVLTFSDSGEAITEAVGGHENMYFIVDLDTDYFVGDYDKRDPDADEVKFELPQGYAEFKELGYVLEKEDAAHFTEAQKKEFLEKAKALGPEFAYLRSGGWDSYDYEEAVDYIEGNGISCDPGDPQGEYVCDRLDEDYDGKHWDDPWYFKSTLDEIIADARDYKKEEDAEESEDEDDDDYEKLMKRLNVSFDVWLDGWDRDEIRQIERFIADTPDMEVGYRNHTVMTVKTTWDGKAKLSEFLKKLDKGVTEGLSESKKDDLLATIKKTLVDYIVSTGYPKEDVEEWVVVGKVEDKDQFGNDEEYIQIRNEFVDFYDLPGSFTAALNKATGKSFFIEPESSKVWNLYDESEHLNEAFFEDQRYPFGEKAWMLNNILAHMNNEEAYYSSGWLYVWPDECSKSECNEYFGADEEEYTELEDLFKRIYSNKAYHRDGLYKASPETVEAAHEWDKQLGLPPIDVLTPNPEPSTISEAEDQEIPPAQETPAAEKPVELSWELESEIDSGFGEELTLTNLYSLSRVDKETNEEQTVFVEVTASGKFEPDMASWSEDYGPTYVPYGSTSVLYDKGGVDLEDVDLTNVVFPEEIIYRDEDQNVITREEACKILGCKDSDLGVAYDFKKTFDQNAKAVKQSPIPSIEFEMATKTAIQCEEDARKFFLDNPDAIYDICFPDDGPDGYYYED